jgi:hypothetical protein
MNYRPHIPDAHGDDGILQLPSEHPVFELPTDSATANADNFRLSLLLPHSHRGVSESLRTKYSTILPHCSHSYSYKGMMFHLLSDRLRKPDEKTEPINAPYIELMYGLPVKGHDPMAHPINR